MKDQLVIFTQKHWPLALAWVGVIVMFIINEIRIMLNGSKKISVSELVNMVNNKDALVIDIRNTDAYNSGHITDAVHIESKDLSTAHKALVANKNKPVILVCNRGISAQDCAKNIKDYQGEVFILDGGMTAWHDDKMPVVK